MANEKLYKNVRTPVLGAPYQPGQKVRIVASVEPPGGADASHYIGREGVVEHLDYACGCGQKYPEDPMMGVRFEDGQIDDFWAEELALRP